MRVFFTQETKAVEARQDITAVDIWSKDFSISVRESGIRITNNKTKEEVTDAYMNLSEGK